jgi:alkanesulfonate monooxygenase SsuD/methylene tetrahydromethanopterin reductase-like flavin-dependent oxidoreductase (luciferase family)
VRIDAPDPDAARTQRTAILAEAERGGRDPGEVCVIVDLAICINTVSANASERFELIEAITTQRFGGDGARFVGTPQELAETLAMWLEADACDGFTFLPASLPIDLVLVVDRVIPELRRRGLVDAGAVVDDDARGVGTGLGAGDFAWGRLGTRAAGSGRAVAGVRGRG